MKLYISSSMRTPLPKTLVALVLILLQTGCSLMGIRSTEEPDYSLLQQEDRFEVRDYETLVVAETLVDANFEDAGGIAFKRLFGYISGDNEAASSISMTAPVMALDENRSSEEEISMTAPVTGQQTQLGWRFAFVLPTSYTLDTAPVPSNTSVKLKQIPARKVAAVRYTGTWNETAYEENLEFLQHWMERNRLEAASLPRVAAYDPPWTLPFLRRNEILIDIQS